MNRLALILGLGAMMAQAASAAPAQVGSWTKACQANTTTKSLTSGNYACYTPAAGAESASPILDVTACENIDVFLWSDYDGDGTACTVEWAIEGCAPGASGLSTDAAKNNACAILAGVSVLSGNDVEAKLAGTEVRVVGQGAGANINSCRVVVKCALDATK